MNPERLLEHYHRVADSEGAGPRLRRFVLNLAVRGKLVEQDSMDEPAVELLKRIAVEKVRLVEAKEIRKPRNLPNGENMGPLFEIPATWHWCRLDTIGAIIGGGTPPAADPTNFVEPGEGVPWLTPADLGGYTDLYIKRGSRDLSKKGLQSSSATMMPTGTVLFTSRAPIGYVAIAANPISTNQGFKSIVPYVEDCSRFIAIVAKTFAPDIDATAPGTTFKEVSGKIVSGVPFPLPPLAEQHRIVAKVDELMALCDQLEAACNERETTRDRLTAAGLARLTTPETRHEEFGAHARFTLGALPALTARPSQIKALRQTILNLAVRGKLAEQNPADESPFTLLTQARRDLKKRAETVKRMRWKQTDPVDPDEVHKNVPMGWVAARINDTGLYINGLAFKPVDWKQSGVPIVRIQNLTDPAKGFNYAEGDFPDEVMVRNGDLLVSWSATLEAFRWERGDVVLNQHIFRVIPDDSLTTRDFLLLVLRNAIREMADSEHAHGLVMTHINRGPFLNHIVLIPPLSEQYRIVATVDKLMVLCDQLKATRNEHAATRQRLLEALLHEALSPEEKRELAI